MLFINHFSNQGGNIMSMRQPIKKEHKTVVKAPGKFKRVNILEDGTVEIISIIEESADSRQVTEERKE